MTPDCNERALLIGYPLIVKPLRAGGHLGVSEDSIVRDGDALEQAVRRNAERFRQPSLVERYLDGPGMREFSVGVIGSRGRLFTPVEVDWGAMPAGLRILSWEAAQRDLERVQPVRDLGPPRCWTTSPPGPSTRSARWTTPGSTSAWTGGLLVLEINIMPGLGPHSFLPMAARELHGLDFGALVRRLAEEAMLRLGIDPAAPEVMRAPSGTVAVLP